MNPGLITETRLKGVPAAVSWEGSNSVRGRVVGPHGRRSRAAACCRQDTAPQFPQLSAADSSRRWTRAACSPTVITGPRSPTCGRRELQAPGTLGSRNLDGPSGSPPRSGPKRGAWAGSDRWEPEGVSAAACLTRTSRERRLCRPHDPAPTRCSPCRRVPTALVEDPHAHRWNSKPFCRIHAGNPHYHDKDSRNILDGFDILRRSPVPGARRCRAAERAAEAGGGHA